MLTIDRLDHFVLTVADIDATVEFYARVLGMADVTFGQGRSRACRSTKRWRTCAIAAWRSKRGRSIAPARQVRCGRSTFGIPTAT
jgi:catechol-2,3-dioxygenase